MDPDNAGALNYLGYMLADRNVRLDEAQKLVSKAVELEPQNGAYLDSLGWFASAKTGWKKPRIICSELCGKSPRIRRSTTTWETFTSSRARSAKPSRSGRAR